jgi:hypothetical protein
MIPPGKPSAVMMQADTSSLKDIEKVPTNQMLIHWDKNIQQSKCR